MLPRGRDNFLNYVLPSSLTSLIFLPTVFRTLFSAINPDPNNKNGACYGRMTWSDQLNFAACNASTLAACTNYRMYFRIFCNG